MHGHRMKAVIFGVATAFSLLIAACAGAAPTATAGPTATPAKATPAPTATTAPPPPAPREQPRRGGTLNSANYAEPSHLDLQQGQNIHWTQLLKPAYDGLLQLDENANIVADLAQTWQISADGTVVTFGIRPGVKWHDGRPLTVEDIRFSLLHMARPPSGVTTPRGQVLLANMATVNTPDDRTVVLTLKEPSASFLSGIATDWVPIAPKHVIEAKGSMKKDVVGTGPYKFKGYTPGTSYEYVRNSEYWAQGLPYLDGITIFIIPDDEARFAAFQTGRLHLTAQSKPFTKEQREVLVRDYANKVAILTFSSLSRSFVLFNLNNPMLQDIRARQAVNLAINRQAHMKIRATATYLGGNFDPKGAWAVLSSDDVAKMPGFRPDKSADLAEAKRLVADLKDRATTLTMVSRADLRRAEAEAIKFDLEQVGFKIDLKLTDATGFVDLQTKGRFDLLMHGYGEPIDDPTPYLSLFKTGAPRNNGGYSNPTYDRLTEDQDRIFDPAARKAKLTPLEKILQTDLPWTLILWEATERAAWSTVRGFTQGPGYFVHNKLAHVWLSN